MARCYFSCPAGEADQSVVIIVCPSLNYKHCDQEAVIAKAWNQEELVETEQCTPWASASNQQPVHFMSPDFIGHLNKLALHKKRMLAMLSLSMLGHAQLWHPQCISAIYSHMLA